ncbi:cytochrome c biogenesis protein CcsA [Sulfurospirillum sp. 1307]
MKSFLKGLLSMKVAIVFLLLFAVASGVATFIENDFGTAGSWGLVYESKWFEFIQVYLGISIIYNLYKYRVFKMSKLPSAMFHIGFVVILIGAGITRYMGYEGSLHIREGNIENRVVSSDSYIQASASKNGKTYSVAKKKTISAISDNDFNMKLNVDGEIATIKYKNFIPNATTSVVDDPNGKPLISMMVSGSMGAKNVILGDGEVTLDNAVTFSFNNPVVVRDRPVVNFYTKDDGKFYFKSSEPISWFKMVENKRGQYEANKEYPFIGGQLYTIHDTNFAPKFIGLKGVKKVVQDKNPMQRNKNALSALVVEVDYKGQTKEVTMFGRGKGSKGFAKQVEIAGDKFSFEWGSQIYVLPFGIKLIDFQLDRYPGSMSPMSYASEVEVVDKEKGVNMPFRIYMNHVLDYRGFRFFQASYDTDELGTILSVNSDPGKWPTYIGYILLSLGMFLNLLNPKSRFRKLSSLIQRDTVKMKSTIIAFLALFSMLNSNSLQAAELGVYDKAHADKFGEILVQSADGRIKPIDTVSTEVLNKVYRKSTYKGLSANQVILGMMADPAKWQNEPMIHVFHPELKKLLGLPKNVKKATFNDFFEKDGSFAYKLQKYAEEANRKKPVNRNKFDKDVIKVDERVNIVYFVYTGEMFKMIPKIGDPNHKWYSPKSAISLFPKDESDDVRHFLASYFEGLSKGVESGDWSSANKAVEKIKSYQEQYASDIMPSPSRISAEKFFNKAAIFDRLTPVYLLSGLILLFSIFAKMIKPTMSLRLVSKIIFFIVALGFVAHTFGLGLRAYIAEHAPWSDGYESMIYIAWAIVLAGLFFSRQSIVSLALTSILAGVTLFVAHLSWMDPQITTLVPVLKSYWLNIHVSVITASYGFLGLCGLLGFFTMILFIIRGKNTKNKRAEEIDRNITEATRINEMAMILGLSLLTVGNFLGGVWANESWGRYWGWDPKETWALVSILIYAAVLHMRFVKSLNNQFAFAVASTVSFASIIMTYFGVNFYLSGMHSYAAGDPVPIPTFVYYTVAIVALVIALATRNRKIAKPL